MIEHTESNRAPTGHAQHATSPDDSLFGPIELSEEQWQALNKLRLTGREFRAGLVPKEAYDAALEDCLVIMLDLPCSLAQRRAIIRKTMADMARRGMSHDRS